MRCRLLVSGLRGKLRLDFRECAEEPGIKLQVFAITLYPRTLSLIPLNLQIGVLHDSLPRPVDQATVRVTTASSPRARLQSALRLQGGLASIPDLGVCAQCAAK